MGPAPDPARPARTPGGFTLVELLVAMALATIIGGAVVSLVLRQSRFYAHHGEYLQAERTVRAAGDLAAAELRGAGPGDLLAAGPDSVSVRMDAYRAVVCSHTPSLNMATLFVYDSVTNANLPGTLGYAISPLSDSAFYYADGWVPSVSVTTGAKTACTDRGAPDLPGAWRYRRLVGWSSSGLSPGLTRGAFVRKYGRLTYRFAASSFGSGTALWRNSQELVAPFDTGAAFSYVLASGDTVATPSDPGDVRAVRLTATAVGEEDPRVEGRRELELVIWLRNER